MSKIKSVEGGAMMVVDPDNQGFSIKELIEAFSAKLKAQGAPMDAVDGVMGLFSAFCKEMDEAEQMALDEIKNDKPPEGGIMVRDENGNVSKSWKESVH